MNDLIGTKRPSRVRSLRTWVTMTILLCVSLAVAYLLYRRVSSYAHPDGSVPKAPVQVDATAPEEGLHYGDARLEYRGELAILHSVGKVHDVGAQQGRLLATQIGEIQRAWQPNVEQTISKAGLFGESLHNIRLRWRWRTLDDGIPGHQLVEIAGLVRGTGKSSSSLSYEKLVRQSAIFDVGKPARGSSGSELWTIGRALTLLAPINSEFGSRMIVARNLSLPGTADGGESILHRPLLHISHPEGALAHASLGWPGLVGVISGINSESLGVFLHFAKTTDVRLTREAQPSALVAKEILENARTIDEGVAILKNAKVLGTAVYVLVEGMERQWAIVERSPGAIEVRRGKSPEAVVDTLDGTKFKDDPINDRSRRASPMLARRKRARQALKGVLKSPDDVLTILRDRKSSSGASLPLGHRAAIDDLESVHCALFDLSGMVLWVSESDASGTFRAIDLRHELRKEGSKPAPPPDLLSESSDQGARSAVREARKLLIEARRMRARGKKRRARELAAAALSRAPNLPEALLVAGRLAQDEGDELAARALLQRLLEVGVDNLQAKEQVEAWLGS